VLKQVPDNIRPQVLRRPSAPRAAERLSRSIRSRARSHRDTGRRAHPGSADGAAGGPARAAFAAGRAGHSSAAAPASPRAHPAPNRSVAPPAAAAEVRHRKRSISRRFARRGDRYGLEVSNHAPPRLRPPPPAANCSSSSRVRDQARALSRRSSGVDCGRRPKRRRRRATGSRRQSRDRDRMAEIPPSGPFRSGSRLPEDHRTPTRNAVPRARRSS
jgi:hypothetical protein